MRKILYIWVSFFTVYSLIAGDFVRHQNYKYDATADSYIPTSTKSLKSVFISRSLMPGYYSISMDYRSSVPMFLKICKGALSKPINLPESNSLIPVKVYCKVEKESPLYIVFRDMQRDNLMSADVLLKNVKISPVNPVNIPEVFNFNKLIKIADENKTLCGFGIYGKAELEKIKQNGKDIISMAGTGSATSQGWIYTYPAPIVLDGKIHLVFTAKSGGGNKRLMILIGDTLWKKGGIKKVFYLSPNWKEYKIEVECKKVFKPGIKLFSVNFYMNPGVYLFSDILLSSSKK